MAEILDDVGGTGKLYSVVDRTVPDEVADAETADPDGALDITKMALATVKEWEQQPGEPLLWYQRFTSYMLLPPGTRSIRRAYRAWLERTDPERFAKDKGNYTPKPWSDRAREWHWKQRVAAYDMAEHNRFLEESAQRKREAEKVCQDLTLAGLKKLMVSIEEADPLELSLRASITYIPRIIEIAMKLFEFGEQDRESTLDAIMAAMPAPLRTQLLTEIRIEQMNVSVQGKENVIEGELVA